MASRSVYAANRKGNSWAYIVWWALVWVVGVTPIVMTLASTRVLDISDVESIASNTIASEGGLTHLLYQAIVGLTLGLGMVGLVMGMALRGAWLPRAGLGLWISAMAFAVGPLLSSYFGLQPTFSLTVFSLPILFTAVYLLPPVSLTWFVSQVKAVLLLYAYGSLLAVLVAPRWALERSYVEGLIPGLDVRLYGLGAHPNTLATLLLTYLLIDWLTPFKTRWGRVHQVVVLLGLVLAQSKTIWVLLILAYLIRMIYASLSLPPLQRYSALTLSGAALGAGILYLAIGPAWLDSADNLLPGSQLATLNGRTLIWQYTLDIWERNPWFGYGPDLWNAEMRLQYAYVTGWIFAHAHNQVVQTLGESGVVGAAGLFLYVAVFLVYGVRYAQATGVVAASLVVVILLRGITEIPLIRVIADANFFLHLLTFAFLVLASRQNKL